MTTSFCDCQVLVVGAGPTGLVLAAQLLARGIDTRIVDKGDGPARESRAVSVHARTLELLDTMGLAETFIEHGHCGRRFRMYIGNRSLLNLDMTRNGSALRIHPESCSVRDERLLRARVRELERARSSSEASWQASAEAPVTLTLRDAEGRETEIRAGYMIGCDRRTQPGAAPNFGLAFAGQPCAQSSCWPTSPWTDSAAKTPRQASSSGRNGRTLICLPMGDTAGA